MHSFADIVEREASVLSAAHSMRLRVVAANDVLLLAERFALRLRLDRDGVSLTYVDREGGDLRGYDLFGYLWRKRRTRLRFDEGKPKPEDEVRAQVSALVRHLLTAAEDILEGKKDWQADYGLAPFSVSELASVLGAESHVSP